VLKHIVVNFARDEFVAEWLAFYDVIDAQWFTGAWIFQEFIVARKIHLIYGGRSMPWEALRSLSASLWLSHYLLLGDGPQSLKYSSCPDGGGRKDRNLRRLKEKAARNESSAAIVRLTWMVEHKDNWNGRLDLKELLTHSSYSKTTDPRDKIFAFIGLADPSYAIIPNYSHSLDQILIDTTMNIIRVENDLAVILYAPKYRPHDDFRLPSWVVHWAAGEPYNRTKPMEVDFLRGKKANAAFSTMKTSHGRLWALHLCGLCIDSFVVAPANTGKKNSLVSPKGLLFIDSGFVQDEDEVWILNGCGVPVVLRPRNAGMCLYRLIFS